MTRTAETPALSLQLNAASLMLLKRLLRTPDYTRLSHTQIGAIRPLQRAVETACEQVRLIERAQVLACDDAGRKLLRHPDNPEHVMLYDSLQSTLTIDPDPASIRDLTSVCAGMTTDAPDPFDP